MPTWTWYGGNVNRYRDERGRFTSVDTIRAWGQAAIDGNRDGMAELARQVAAQEISLGQWETQMRTAIKAEMEQQYMLGKGGRSAMTARDRSSIGGMLAEQYGFLSKFATRIAAGQYSEAQIAMIAQMYINSTREAFEKGAMRARGILKLPAYPGDGSSECLCVVSPEAPVLTQRGWLPLADVVVGDHVLTHRMRWREVKAVIMKPAQPEHKLAVVDGIEVTDNHLWYTNSGWRNANDIYNSGIDVLSLADNQRGWLDEDLRGVRWRYGQPGEARPVQSMQVGVSLRQLQGPAGCGVFFLRDVAEGQGPVAGTGRQDACCDSTGRGEAQDDAREPGKFDVADPLRQASVELVLETRSNAQEHDLPLSVGMDHGTRTDPGRDGDSSHQFGCNGRSLGESGTNACQGTLQVAQGNSAREVTGADAGVDVLDMRNAIQETPAGAWRRAEVLLPGMLLAVAEKAPVALFDLTVDEDESFCIGGIFAHNTNCRCFWDIHHVKNRYEATWTLTPAEHCETCLERASDWAPFVVPDEDLAPAAA